MSVVRNDRGLLYQETGAEIRSIAKVYKVILNAQHCLTRHYFPWDFL